MINFFFTLVCLLTVAYAQNDTSTTVTESALYDRILTYVAFGLAVVFSVSYGVYKVYARCKNFSKTQTLDLEMQVAQKISVRE